MFATPNCQAVLFCAAVSIASQGCLANLECERTDFACHPVLLLLRPATRSVAKFILGSHAAGISVFSMDYAGTLTGVNGSPFATGGTGAHHMSVHPSAKFVYLANQGSSNISAFQVDSSSGALAPVPGSPFAAGASMYAVTVHPSGRYLYAGSEGVSLIYAYSIDTSSGALVALPGSPFAAGANFPGSVSADPLGRFLYAGFTNGTGQVGAYSIASDGAISAVPGSPFPGGNDAISVSVDPAGRFVFAANYFTNNTFSYNINSSSGALTQAVGTPSPAGAAPGYVAADPTGRFAYVSSSGDGTGLLAVAGYTINSTTGALTQITGSPFAAGKSPIGLSVEPQGLFAFSANTGEGSISMLSMNQETGALARLRAYGVGSSVFGVTFVPATT